jgi:hypothetical protein
MKIAECSYCGIFAITEQDACENCQTALEINLPAAVEKTNQINQFNEETNVQVNVVSTSIKPDNQVFPQTQQSDNGFDTPQHYWQPALDSKCLRCGTPVQTGQSRCFDCDSIGNVKKSPLIGISKILLIFAVFIGGYMLYQYVNNSPGWIFRKYAKATGADNSIIFENFSLNGESQLMIGRYSNQQNMLSANQSNSYNFQQEGLLVAEDFSFTMIFKKPDKFSLEFIKEDTSPNSKGSYTAFKQVFDGIKGWKFTNINNQSPRYEDSDDAFAEKKMGMGLEEFDSMEVVQATDENIKMEYGPQTIKTVTDLSNLIVEGATISSDKKVIIYAKKKHNGKTDASLMFFDEKTGFLIATIKKAEVDGKVVISKIYTNSYNKFPVKKKGFFGKQSTLILIPTKWTITTEPSIAEKTGITMTITLNIKKVDVDTNISDDIFDMQKSK